MSIFLKVLYPNDNGPRLYEDVPMLRHSDIWRAVDRLANEHGFSASGLARRAGLDPTTFNKSKRSTPSGRLRWPNTESLSKALEATGASLDEFLAIKDELNKLKKSYVSKFDDAIPTTKVARYYQLEQKIEALINFDLAKHIPLAE